MSNPEQNHFIPQSQRARDLTNLVRDQITKYQAGEISRLPKRKELNEQAGYSSSVSFNRVLLRSGLLEEWRRIKKIKQTKSRTYFDNSGVDQNIPPILHDTHGRLVWTLPNNTPEDNEQIGINNVQGVFLKKFPDFNESYPRGEDGMIAEGQREKAKEFIRQKLRSRLEFIKVFTGCAVDRKYTPYFDGSHIVAIQKTSFSWGLKFERSEFGKSGRAEILLRNEAFVPSRELAWIIGVLAGGGYSNPHDKRISLDSGNEEFIREFKSAGERLFGINASVMAKKGENNTRELKGVTFHSREAAKAMGDLRGSEWPSTIIGQHKWIIENSNYLWSFIEGLFERKGGVYTTRGKVRKVSIHTDSVVVANFIMELLVRLGIENPVITNNKRGREGIKGVSLYNIRDIKHFAENIHSRIPDKEKRLSICRELKRYGHDISNTVMLDNKATQEKFDVASALHQYEDEKGVQVNYTPKLHRVSEEKERRRLEQILVGSQELSESQILLGADSTTPIFPQNAVDDHIMQIAESHLENKDQAGTELYVASKSGQEKLLVEILPKGFKHTLTQEQIRKKAAEFYNIFGELSVKILRNYKRWDLLNGIRRYKGEMKQLKVDLGLESTVLSQQQKFSLEQIEDEAHKIYQQEGRITKDLLESLGRQDLVWAIRRHYPGRYKALRVKLEEISDSQERKSAKSKIQIFP